MLSDMTTLQVKISLTLFGPEFNIGRKTVPLIILTNVTEDSEAFTYV